MSLGVQFFLIGSCQNVVCECLVCTSYLTTPKPISHEWPAMHPVINCVNTRCTEGNHALLQSWYADHVHLLLASPQLMGAQLHRCVLALHGQPPDYACAYEFSSWADFEQFESGVEKAQATQLTNAAAGRSAIEIVQRVQYARVMNRRFGAAPAAAPQGLLIQLEMPSAQPQASARWLAHTLQEARSALPLHSAQVLMGIQESHLWQLHLSMGPGDPSQAWALLETLLQQPARYGHAPENRKVRWVAATVPVMQWLR